MTKRETHKPVHKFARQGNGFFSMIRSEFGKNSQFEVAEFDGNGQMVEQFMFATLFEDRREATERDQEIAETVLAKLRYINDFPMAAQFEGVRASIDRLIREHYGRN